MHRESSFDKCLELIPPGNRINKKQILIITDNVMDRITRLNYKYNEYDMKRIGYHHSIRYNTLGYRFIVTDTVEPYRGIRVDMVIIEKEITTRYLNGVLLPMLRREGVITRLIEAVNKGQ